MEQTNIKTGKGFRIFTYLFLAVISLAAILPILLIFIASFTSEDALVLEGYRFFPSKLSAEAYIYIISQSSRMLRSYGVSILVTALGTLFSVFLSVMFAYPLSRSDFKFRNHFTFFIFFTMLFNGGIVPSYIMWTQFFHIKDTLFALIIPNYLMSAFNVLLVRNYFKNNIPESLLESAKIDGASEWMVFFRIMLPLSVPVIATIALFIGLTYWNDWINGLYYLTSPKLYSIQNLLIQMMDNIQFLNSGAAAGIIGAVKLPSTAVRMAMGVVGIVPVLLIYPFIQKYLIRGTVVGAVKG